MSNDTMQHTPADVRERVDVPGLPDGITPLTGVFTTHHAGRPHAIVLWQGAPWLVWQHPDGHWVTEAKVQVAALFRTPRGEGEAWRAFLDALDEFEAAANLWADPEGPTAADMERLRQSRQRVIECAGVLAARRCDAQGEDTIPVSALRSEIAQLKARGLLPYLVWARLCALAGGGPVGEDTPAALRSEAQGEDRWEDVVFGPITEAYNEAHAARRGEGGGA